MSSHSVSQLRAHARENTAQKSQTPITDEWTEAVSDPSVVIADGYGVDLSISHGQLIINDGIAGQRRVRKIPRMPRTVRRIVIRSTAGTGISLNASQWLADADISWSQVTQDGRILATSGPTRTDARLLRAQAYAVTEPTGLEITRALLTAKLAGQSAICRDILRVPGAAHNIDDLAAELNRAPELDDCRSIEGAAAVAYWQAWADRVTVPFSPPDMLRVPAHWNRFNGRTSAIHPYPRNIHATEPANAQLNYVYRIAETEAVHACHALGLNPTLGILHADKPDRDSFALDLIEAVRPYCDRIVLAMLDVGLGVPVNDRGKPAYLDRRWFHETKDGQCRLVAPLTHQLASHAADIGAGLRPHAEHAARILANAASGTVRIPKERKRDAQARDRAPRTSSRPARLRDGVTAADVIPDELWQRIRGYLPEPPAGPYGHKKTGKPRDTSLDREAVAACAAHELLNLPWGLPRVSASVATCRARLLEWQWSKVNGSSVWEHIASEVQGHGHLAALIAA
jgi:CRISPR-associated endonuclease Cas1